MHDIISTASATLKVAELTFSHLADIPQFLPHIPFDGVSMLGRNFFAAVGSSRTSLGVKVVKLYFSKPINVQGKE
jgi:hypothetical protein